MPKLPRYLAAFLRWLRWFPAPSLYDLADEYEAAWRASHDAPPFPVADAATQSEEVDPC